MKKILIAILVLGIAFSSCIYKDEMGDPVIGTAFNAPTLNDVSGTFVFTEEKADDVFQTFSWSAADFGFQAAINYTVQIDFTGNSFASAVDLVTTSNTEYSITVGDLNQKLLAMGAKTNVPSDFDVRVVASINDNVETVKSNVPVMNIHPYKVIIIYPSLYLPGNYQAASGYESDWSPDKAQQIYSLKQNDKYEGYVNMAGDDIQFKFTDGPNWDLNWGDSGADGTLDTDGDNIAVPEAGYYRMKADITALTYSIMKTDWGLIGSATPDGWDSDQDMTYDMVSKKWSVTLDLVEGEIKFRANDDWGLNYGDTGFDGSLEEGGDNIAISAAGNYTIVLNLEVAGYAYEIIKN
ncbi:MAG: SusE domain-containing protein [Draconibacterium sp.]|nr:SusE domain-containing protein [Draconibacterium sp.]